MIKSYDLSSNTTPPSAYPSRYQCVPIGTSTPTPRASWWSSVHLVWNLCTAFISFTPHQLCLEMKRKEESGKRRETHTISVSFCSPILAFSIPFTDLKYEEQAKFLLESTSVPRNPNFWKLKARLKTPILAEQRFIPQSQKEGKSSCIDICTKSTKRKECWWLLGL